MAGEELPSETFLTESKVPFHVEETHGDLANKRTPEPLNEKQNISFI